MNWYIGKIVFRINSGHMPRTAQFDEQLRLLSARNTEEAFLKARTIGISEEDCLTSDGINRVTWEFIGVTEMVQVKRLEDGAELYSCIREADEAGTFIREAHQKAMFIRTESLSQTS